MGIRRFAMTEFFAALVTVLAAFAFLVGYWPEHRRRQALEGGAPGCRCSLPRRRPGVRPGGVLDQLLATQDAVSAEDCGQAQALSAEFSDAVGAEATRTVAGSSRDALQNVLRMRGPVTASLTLGDPQALALLQDADSVVRSTLGFSRPTAP
jgi:hypothetical protein